MHDRGDRTVAEFGKVFRIGLVDPDAAAGIGMRVGEGEAHGGSIERAMPSFTQDPGA